MQTEKSTNSGEETGELLKFQSVQPLKQQFISFPGDPPLKWEVWINIFNDYCSISQLENLPESRHLALLRSSLGIGGYRI